MSFYGETFIFDGIPSEFHNLYIGTINDSGESITGSSNDVTLITQKLFRRPVPLFWGAEQTPVLQFPLSIYSPDEISAEKFSAISGWLFGQQNYKKLIICQNDMPGIYYNCFLTAPQIIRIGNMIQAITMTVVCDSPWGWKTPKTEVYSYDSYQTHETVYFFCDTDNAFYTYPTSFVIRSNNFAGSLTITNLSDLNRQSTITLTYNEVTAMNCDLELISSSKVTYPLGNFNKNWLRLVRGYNTLVIDGNINFLSITYPRAVKVGG